MARLKIFMYLAMLIFFLSFVYASCEQDINSLGEFYKASQEQDYAKYISLMDTDYIYNYLADEQAYSDYVNSAWEVYDVLSYDINVHKCNEIETGSIIFFGVKSEIVTEGKKTKIDRIYVAVFEYGKIQFVTDYEIFSFHQNLVYYSDYYSNVKDIVEQEIESVNTISKFVSENDIKKKRSSSWIFIFILLVLSIAYFLFKKGLFANFKHHTKKNILRVSGVAKDQYSKIHKHIKKHTSKK